MQYYGFHKWIYSCNSHLTEQITVKRLEWAAERRPGFARAHARYPGTRVNESLRRCGTWRCTKGSGGEAAVGFNLPDSLSSRTRQ